MRIAVGVAFGLALLIPISPAGGATDVLADDFSRWKGGLPEGWEARVGATSGTDKDSEVAKGPEGGLLLRGDASTGKWRVLVRPFEVKEGACYRLSFEARGTGLRLEARQFDNAFVGVSLPAAGGKAERHVAMVGERGWAPDEVVVRARFAGRAEAWVFLSRTGTLEVRSLRLEELGPADSWDVLVRNMSRYYSHFASKGVDWPKLAEARRAEALAAKDEAGFVKAARGLLSELKDVHVYVRRTDGTIEPTHVHARKSNYDYAAVIAALKDPQRMGRMALAGTTGKDLGYLGVFSLPSSEEEFRTVAQAFEGMLGRRGILLDLRACSGGDERRAQALASALVKERTVYARTRVRSGPRPEDLAPPVDRFLLPREGKRFDGPVVCLVGPGCLSSGEGFAQMLAAIPGVVLAGQPTAGASGNPAPVDLPNGVTVIYSRWVDLLPDGTPLEGRGVPPDVLLTHEGPGDPTFAAGVEILEKAASAAGR